MGYSLLKIGVSILTDRPPQRQPAIDELITYRVARALCFSSCRTYRSILRLAEIGASRDCDMLARTLFEGTLATMFVLGQEPRQRPRKWHPGRWRRELAIGHLTDNLGGKE
jgi:hypothetical protein